MRSGLLLGLIVAAALAAATVGAGHDARRDPATGSLAVRAADAFAAAALDPRQLDTAPQLRPEDLRAWARRRAALIPLPAGGNFNGIGWEAAGGPVSVVEADLTLQYNARCQWLRAQAERRAPEAGAVLEAIGRWPVSAMPAAPELMVGSREAGLLRGCQISHARELSYAVGRGLPPSS